MNADAAPPDADTGQPLGSGVEPTPQAAYSQTPRSWTGAGLGLAIALVVLVGPFPTCFFKLAVGAPCPGCGLTRATLAMLQLDWAGVLRFHPLAPLVSPLLGWLLLRPALVRSGLVSEERFRLSPRATGWLAVGVILALWGVYVARLAGALGGHPDPVVLQDGWLTRWWF